MYTEKQIEEIEEMALTACLDKPGNKELVCINHKMGGYPCDSRCKIYRCAKVLYNAGYRKADEVAREVCAEIDEFISLYYREDTYNVTDLIEDIYRIEKKYTQEK